MNQINKDFEAIYSKEEKNFIKRFQSIEELKEYYFNLRIKGYESHVVGNANDLISWLTPPKI